MTARRGSRRARFAAVLASVLVAPVGCHGPGTDSEDAARPGAGPTSAPASPPPSSGVTTPPVAPGPSEPLAGWAYRAAYQRLVERDTGRFDLRILGRGPDTANLFLLPQGEGAWELSSGRSSVSITVTNPETGRPFTVLRRQIEDAGYVRVDGAGSVFGRTCWARIPDVLPAELTDGSPLLAEDDGVPAGLLLLDRYRAADRPDAGTVPLSVVLGAFGFGNALLDPTVPWRTRVPVEIELDGAEIGAVVIRPADVSRVLQPAAGASETASAVVDTLGSLPEFHWRVEYGDLGSPVTIVPPAPDLLVPLDDGTTCPD